MKHSNGLNLASPQSQYLPLIIIVSATKNDIFAHNYKRLISHKNIPMQYQKLILPYLLIWMFSLIIGQNSAYSQDFNPYYQSIVGEIDIPLLQEHLQTHEDFGAKQVGTEALNNSFDWLKSNYENWGYTDIDIDTFYYAGHECYNLIVTKTGTNYPDQYVIIDGHYDSYNGPGTDDNGTGTAIVLESARLLKDITTEYSVRFIHFSAEEVGLVGSSHYVDHVVVPEDHDIKLVYNIDAVGGVNGMNNEVIICERDESYPHENDDASSMFTDTLAVLMEMYSNIQTEISYAYATDYVPFMEEGYIITGLYEANENPYAHSPNDILANMDIAYFNEVAKGAVGAALFFTGAYNSVSVSESILADHFQIYPNPVSDILHLKSTKSEQSVHTIKVMNLQGKVILETAYQSNLDLSSLASGLYLLSFEIPNQRPIIKKIHKIDGH